MKQSLTVSNETFITTVVYTDDAWRTKRGHKTDKFNNCTEFHWRFNQNEDITVKEAAFESDIHGTGCTRKVDEIESVIIEYPIEVAESY